MRSCNGVSVVLVTTTLVLTANPWPNHGRWAQWMPSPNILYFGTITKDHFLYVLVGFGKRVQQCIKTCANIHGKNLHIRKITLACTILTSQKWSIWCSLSFSQSKFVISSPGFLKDSPNLFFRCWLPFVPVSMTMILHLFNNIFIILLHYSRVVTFFKFGFIILHKAYCHVYFLCNLTYLSLFFLFT